MYIRCYFRTDIISSAGIGEMAERQQRRFYLLHFWLDGDDRNISTQVPESTLRFLKQNSTRTSLNENTKSRETSARFTQKHLYVPLDAAD